MSDISVDIEGLSQHKYLSGFSKQIERKNFGLGGIQLLNPVRDMASHQTNSMSESEENTHVDSQ